MTVTLPTSGGIWTLFINPHFPSLTTTSPSPSPSPSSSSSLLTVTPNQHHHQHRRRRSPLRPPIRHSVRCSSSLDLSGMDSSLSQTLYPLHRCKTIHLVRHAQGVHNVEGEKDHDAYKSEELFDAHLTPTGWQQVDNLRKHVQASGISKKIELVIVSPLLRTMQTAVGTFGGEGYSDGIDAPPLMVENVGESNHPAISSLNCPPFIAVELCREHLGVHPCDRRRSVSEYVHLFPAIDFSLIENDADVLWEPDVREKNEDVGARGLKFLNWLWTRKEKEIAVVTHSGFLIHTLSAFGNDCHPSVKSEICNPLWTRKEKEIAVVTHSGFLIHTLSAFGNDCHPSVKSEICNPLWTRKEKEIAVVTHSGFLIHTLSAFGNDCHPSVKSEICNPLWTRKEKEIAVVTHSGFLIHTLSAFGNDCHPSVKSEICNPFKNCELRSVVIVDRSMTGSDTSSTDYPGKIPSGADLPSEAAN